MQQSWVDIKNCSHPCPLNTRCIRPIEFTQPIECLHNTIPIEQFSNFLEKGKDNNFFFLTIPELIIISLLVIPAFPKSSITPISAGQHHYHHHMPPHS
jgi:hypothetical protein